MKRLLRDRLLVASNFEGEPETNLNEVSPGAASSGLDRSARRAGNALAKTTAGVSAQIANSMVNSLNEVGLQRLGKKVEYRIYENEGHVIARKANVLDFWKRQIEFLDEYLDITRDDRGQMIVEDGRAKGRPRTSR